MKKIKMKVKNAIEKAAGVITVVSTAVFLFYGKALAADPNPWQGGKVYDIGITPVAANVVATIHQWGSIAGAIGIGYGFLYQHNHINPNAKTRGYEIIAASAAAMLGSYFAPQIWQFLVSPK